LFNTFSFASAIEYVSKTKSIAEQIKNKCVSMENNTFVHVLIASSAHTHYAEEICDQMESSAKARGTGIAKRSPEYVAQKMLEGKAVIAFTDAGVWVGFCYIETWGHGKYVANSGLIVAPDFRKGGMAKRIKQEIFNLSRKKYPEAKIFGLTTGLAVMKINSELGYEPVTYSELTDDDAFWNGCKSCVNYEILMSKERKNCLCTAMLFDPEEKIKKETETPAENFKRNSKLYERWMRFKKHILLRTKKIKSTISIF
jgi:hypothetical protein